MSVAQGRHGEVSIGGTAFPFLSWGLYSPRNLIIGQPLGSSWGINWAEGLRTSRFLGRFWCRNKSTEVLALALWNLWLSRTFSGGMDNVAASTIIAKSGGQTYTLLNAKAEAFVLTISSGAVIGLDVIFVSPSNPTRAAQTPADYSNTVSTDPPLTWDAASFTGISNIYAAEVRYANNHVVDAPLNQTKAASGFDAGSISCSASVTLKEGGTPPTDEVNLTIALTGAGPTTRTLSLTRCVPQNTDDGEVQGPGQVYHRFDMNVLGDSSNPPVTIT